MRRISSGMTFFYKRIFPIIWFGFLVLFIAAPIVAPLFGGSFSGSPVGFLLVPAFMMIIGYFMMKKLLFDLVDEVLDAGDALVIRNGHLEERVALSEIMNVGYTPFMNPPRVTLSLRNPGVFGERVSFCAPVSLMPTFSTSPIIDELIKRIDAARMTGRTASPHPGHRR
jgi:hypothetical protein